jgi:glutamate-1-semialdehyde 2,1-aminomutase
VARPNPATAKTYSPPIQYAIKVLVSILDSLRAKTPGSLARYERARHSLAGGVSSGLRRNAKPYPLYFTGGAGPRLQDVDGNTYLDYTLGWGPLILGHAHPVIHAALEAQARKGTTFGAQCDLEYEFAERLCRLIPCADLVAFANSGTEIVQLALRLARAITGRNKYLKFEGHYHGWSDQALVSYHPAASDPIAPVPVGQGQLPHDHVVIAEWNSREQVQQALDSHPGIGAILCEPLLANSGCIPPAPGFLDFLRAESTRRGILLIFDEVITGFRLALGGAQKFYGVTPDLAIFAKAIGAGLPLSALAGRREFMDYIARGEVVHAGTLNGNPLTLAASQAALSLLEAHAAEIYPRLHNLGRQLIQGLQESLAPRTPIKILGEGPCFCVHFLDETPTTYRTLAAVNKPLYEAFLLALLDQGVMALPDGRWYISAVHTPADIDTTLIAIRAAAASLSI